VGDHYEDSARSLDHHVEQFQSRGVGPVQVFIQLEHGPLAPPTNMISASGGPSPNTVWVAFFHNGQARQEAASLRKSVVRLAVVG
jgi:hypothetical protein